MTHPNENEDEYYDSATSEFPAKEDLKDRLVAIWNTGVHGHRTSEATGKNYGFVETVTLVLDDGPNGWQETRPDGDPNLVPSIEVEGPQRLDGFQWSAAGVYSRVSKRSVGGKPMIGRINSMKNKKKGMADAWSIAEMTDADKEIARKHIPLFKEIGAEIADKRQSDEDAEAFN